MKRGFVLTLLIVALALSGCSGFVNGTISDKRYSPATGERPQSFEILVTEDDGWSGWLKVSEEVYREYQIGSAWMEPFAK